MLNIGGGGGVFTDFIRKYKSYAFIALLLLLCWLDNVGTLEPAVQWGKKKVEILQQNEEIYGREIIALGLIQCKQEITSWVIKNRDEWEAKMDGSEEYEWLGSAWSCLGFFPRRLYFVL